MDKKKFYMTTAIAYTSGKPHIGNTYEFVLADAIARYKRRFSKDYMNKVIFTKDTTKECTVHLVSHFSQNLS